jgi:NADH:ubiquinone oxidoreductase subunit E
MNQKDEKIEAVFQGQVAAEELAAIDRILLDERKRGNGAGSSSRIYGEIRKYIAETEGQAGALIRVLQKTQLLVGYLPPQVIKAISYEMKYPLSEIYGIVSFYHFFSLHPKGKHIIQVCMGTSCYVKGGQALLDGLRKQINLLPDHITPDGLFSLEVVRCLGACGLSPVMAVGTDIHGRVKASKLSEILSAYS